MGKKNNFLFLDIDKFLIWKSKFRLLRPICKIPPEVHFQSSVPLNLFLNFHWKTKSSWPLGNGLPETELSSICVWTFSLTEKPASGYCPVVHSILFKHKSLNLFYTEKINFFSKKYSVLLVVLSLEPTIKIIWIL